MAVQLTNALLGVRRVDPDQVDAHGAPAPAAPGPASALLPGKVTETDSGSWQLALDPSLWPVRVGDRVVGDGGVEWTVVSTRLIGSPELAAEETLLGLDLDVSFIRVTGQQVTAAGTEPADGLLVGRVGYPV